MKNKVELLKKLVSNIFVIFKRELKGYFNSPVAYIIIIVFLLLCGWFFSAGVFLFNQATIETFLPNIPLFFVFIIPAIAMRTFAEESKSGTIKILTTLPIKDYEIVIGKYLSAVALITITILSTIIHPITVSLLGNLDWGQVIGSYIGLILLGGSFAAVGLFTSSLTRNQVVAFTIGVLICFFFFLLGKILIFIPPFLLSFVEYLSVDYHFENISKGLIDTRDIIYYASITFFFLYATYKILGSRREAKKIQGLLFSSTKLLLVFVVIGIVNFVSYHIFYKIDLTDGKIYSLSKASIKLVRDLKEPLTVKAYFTKNLPAPYNLQRKYLKEMLDEYKSYSRGKVKYEFIDPGESEELRKEAGLAGIPPLRFTQIEKDKYEIKEGYMGVVFNYGDNKEVIPLLRDTAGLEYTITSIIKKLSCPEKKTVGFLTGHRETDIFANERLFELLSSEYNVKNLRLTKESEELNDVDTLIIAGPKEEIKEEEKYQIDQFLMKGKTIAFLGNENDVNINFFFNNKIKTGLQDLLKHYGVSIGDGYVFDLQNQTIGITQRSGFFSITNFVNYPLFPVSTNLNKEHPITKDLESITLPFVSPLKIDVSQNKNLKATVLIESSKKSWHKKEVFSVNPLERFTIDKKDEKGPFILAAIIEGKFKSFFASRKEAIKESPNARIIVVGSSKFIERGFPVQEANFNFFLNMIDWLVQDEALISIRSKGVAFRPLKEVSARMRSLIKYINLFLVPVLYVFYGLFRWKMRLLWKAKISQMLTE